MKRGTKRTALTLSLGLGLALAGSPWTPATVAHPVEEIPEVATLRVHRAAALKIVLDATRSDDPLMRANALEAIQHAPDHALPVVTLALEDPEPGVKFAALYTIGELRLNALVHAAKPLIRRSEQPHVRAAVIYAAARCGVASDALMSEMAGFLQHEDPRVRANAAMLLGRLNNDTAVPLLRRAGLKPVGDMHPGIQWTLLRVQTAEALARLGDARAIDSIRSAAYSQFDEVRILAVLTLGRLGDDSFWPNMNNFLIEDPIEFRLAAAEGLARLGRHRGGMVQVMVEGATHALPTVRAQACFAMAQHDHPWTRAQLAHLLDDEDPTVQLAAAAAVLDVTDDRPDRAATAKAR